MNAFAEWLTRTMEERELGIRQLSTYVGVTHSTIRLWKQGATTPTWENCAKIAAALRVDVGVVRALAGYSPPGEPFDATLTPEEAALLHAWRTAGPEGRRLLLASAEVLGGTADGSAAQAAATPVLTLPQRQGRRSRAG